MAHTKGKFADGHTGWKVLVLEPNHSIGIQKGYSIIYTDDEEHITDYVYEYDDAKLIAAAPELLEALQAIKDYCNYHDISLGSGIIEQVNCAIESATQFDNQK